MSRIFTRNVNNERKLKMENLKISTEDTFFDLFVKVSKAHEKLFPDATLESQCAKFDEEYEEFVNAKDSKDICYEYADCFIVAAGIYRFSKGLGECLGKLLVTDLGKNDALRGELAYAIVDKMNKNIHRKWNNKDGYYKHTSIN